MARAQSRFGFIPRNFGRLRNQISPFLLTGFLLIWKVMVVLKCELLLHKVKVVFNFMQHYWILCTGENARFAYILKAIRCILAWAQYPIPHFNTIAHPNKKERKVFWPAGKRAPNAHPSRPKMPAWPADPHGERDG